MNLSGDGRLKTIGAAPQRWTDGFIVSLFLDFCVCVCVFTPTVGDGIWTPTQSVYYYKHGIIDWVHKKETMNNEEANVVYRER